MRMCNLVLLMIFMTHVLGVVTLLIFGGFMASNTGLEIEAGKPVEGRAAEEPRS